MFHDTREIQVRAYYQRKKGFSFCYTKQMHCFDYTVPRKTHFRDVCSGTLFLIFHQQHLLQSHAQNLCRVESL